MKFTIVILPVHVFFILLTVWSCVSPVQNNDKKDHAALVDYATGFSLQPLEGSGYHVEVYAPDDERTCLFSADLSPEGVPVTANSASNSFRVPVDSLAVFSATQLSGLDMLNELDRVVAITESDFIHNPGVLARLQDGRIQSLGKNGVFYHEKALQLHPDIIFYSPYQLTQAHPLAGTGLIMIPFLDFMETHPLGRAEWLKFTAVFTGDYTLADSLFRDIEQQYNRLCRLTEDVEYRPTVMSDKFFADQWYVPGGRSYVSRMLHDAGADYLWKDDDHVASVPLDMETMLNVASDADYWRIVGSEDKAAGYESLAEENNLYTYFAPFQNRKVLWCDSRSTGYFEKGSLEPHWQLADMIYAFHPQLLPGYRPHYYHILP